MTGVRGVLRRVALSRAGGQLLHAFNLLRLRRGLLTLRGNSLRTHGALLSGCRLDISGRGNVIEISPLARLSGVNILLRGDGHRIRVHRGAVDRGGELWLEGTGCTIEIGAGTTIESAHLAATEEGRSIVIGADCMISSGVQMRTGDSHALHHRGTGERINPPGDITLGERVWVGEGVVILKGVEVSPDVTIGTRSLVTRSIGTPFVVAAGTPAKVIREDTTWTR